MTYDEIGNPLRYYNGTYQIFTWDGRRLATAVKGSNSMFFTYNVDKQKQLSIVFTKLKPPKARSRRKKPATDARRLCDGGVKGLKNYQNP